NLAQHRVIGLDVDAKLGRHVLRRSLAPGTALHGTHGFADLARGPMGRARAPLLAPYLVEDRASYANARVGLKARTVPLVVLSSGLEKPDHTRLDQVLDLHGRRQPPQHVVGDAPDQIHVALDQELAVER